MMFDLTKYSQIFKTIIQVFMEMQPLAICVFTYS